MIPFSDIENMTIERFYNNFIKSKGHKEHRLVLLGVWTIDVKMRLKFLTDEPANLRMYHKVVRGSTHQRRRPENSRFLAVSGNDSLTKRSIGDDDICWLGTTWGIEYNGWNGRSGRMCIGPDTPSLNQIEKGLIAEAMVQIELAMGNISD